MTMTLEPQTTAANATGQNGADRRLLELENIHKVFTTDDVETHALSSVHLEVKKGEFVSISGPSGCGKSTLLSIVGLLDVPSEGTYRLEGTPVQSLSTADRARIRNRQIGFIFQSFNLLGELTVFENVELPLTYRGIGAGERKQRVAVARALAGHPAVLLADEPTGNLDSTNAEGVMDLLRELHQSGTTICMVTHDPRFARFAERTVHLFDGRVVDEQRTR